MKIRRKVHTFNYCQHHMNGRFSFWNVLSLISLAGTVVSSSSKATLYNQTPIIDPTILTWKYFSLSSSNGSNPVTAISQYIEDIIDLHQRNFKFDKCCLKLMKATYSIPKKYFIRNMLRNEDLTEQKNWRKLCKDFYGDKNGQTLLFPATSCSFL